MNEKRIKISKISKELNVGLGTAIDELRVHGFYYSADPNLRIGSREVEILKKSFSLDKHDKEEKSKILLARGFKEFGKLILYSNSLLAASDFFHPDWFPLLSDINNHLVSKWGIMQRVIGDIEAYGKYKKYWEKFNENVKLLKEIARTGKSASLLLGYKINEKLYTKHIYDFNNGRIKGGTGSLPKIEVDLLNVEEHTPAEFNLYLLFGDAIKRCGILEILDMDSECRISLQTIVDNPGIVREPKANLNFGGSVKVNLLKENILIFDTNVLLENPELIHKYIKTYNLVIPAIVLAELDFNKKNINEIISTNAQKALKQIDKALKNYPSKIRIMKFNNRFLSADLDERNNDDKILTVSLELKKLGKQPVIITNDIGFQLKARAQDITILTLKELPHAVLPSN